MDIGTCVSKDLKRYLATAMGENSARCQAYAKSMLGAVGCRAGRLLFNKIVISIYKLLR